jgi:hypothetical protein
MLEAMTITRTELGRQVLKDRSATLTPRQRSALFLVDGKRTLAEFKSAAAAAGASDDDIGQLFKLGMVEAPQAAATEPAPLEAAEPAARPSLSPQDRYKLAYPIAVQLTSELGLRGFRLNLAVEGATTYEALVEVAPRIREAVGDKRYSVLDMALNNHLPTAGA